MSSIDKFNLNSKTEMVLLVSLNIFSFIAIVYFILVPAKGYINSDTASFSNIGRLIFSEKTLFPSNFYFVNNDLLTFSPSVLTGLIGLLLGYGYTSYALAIISLVLLLQFSLYKFAKHHSSSTKIALLVSGTFLAFQSIALNQLMLSYGSGVLITISATLWISIWCKSLFFDKSLINTNKLLFQIIIVSWFMIFASSSRSLVHFIVPILVAFLLTVVYQESKNSDFRFWVVCSRVYHEKSLLTLMLSMVTAFMARAYYTNSILMQDAASKKGFVANDASHSNLNNFFDGFVWITGIKPEVGVLVLTLEAATSCLIFLLFLTLGIIIKKILKQSFIDDTFTIVFLFTSLFFSSYIYFFTSLNVDHTTIRYFYIPLLPILIYVITKTLMFHNILLRKGVSLLLISSTISIGVLYTQIDNKDEMKIDEQIISALKKSSNGTFGGTYWNAQKYEFISGGKLKAFPVYLDPSECVKPFNWLIYTERSTNQLNSIPLLLDDSEYEKLVSFKCENRLQFKNTVGTLKLYEYRGNW